MQQSAQRSQGREGCFSASHEKVELVVNSIMSIVGTPASSQNQVHSSVAVALLQGSVAESLQDRNLGVGGSASVKRERSHQDLEEARGEKRVKVENDVGLPFTSVNGNGMDPSVPHSGVGYCQDTSPGDELAKERDDLRPLVEGTEISTAAPNDITDLTDLLHDLDDPSDSDLEEDEFGDFGSHLLPEALCDDWLQYGSFNENGVQAHTPQPETITRALGFSSEQAQRDGDSGTKVQTPTPQPETITRALDISSEQAQRDGDSGTNVQAPTPPPETITSAPDISSEQAQREGDIAVKVQAHDTIRKEMPCTEIIILDDDDDDLIMFPIMFDPRGETSQLKNTVNSESSRRQLEQNHQSESAVKMEPESLKQPEQNHQLENAVKVEPQSVRQSEKSTELVPSESSQLANAVKLEHGGTRQVLDSRGSHGFEAPTMQGMLHAVQRQPGVMLQTVVQNGSLMWALVPQNTDAMPGSAFSGNHVHRRSPQVNCLPNGLPNGLPYGLGCSSGFVPKNEAEEQAGPSHAWIPPTTSAGLPYYRGHTQPSAMANGNHAIAGQAVQSVPSPFQPAGNGHEAFPSGEQAGPSYDWTLPNNSAVVPYGFGHTQPSAMGNGNHAAAGQAVLSAPSPYQQAGNVHEASTSREQAGPSHGWTPPNTLAVVPFHYDTTVSAPRVEVTRALQQYLFFINEAKDDRARDLLAQRESTSNEIVREGNRRGLECRPDIVAYNNIKKAKADVNPGVNVGDLPGVEVGDTFTYRHQMAVVGLHRLPNVGIDYGHPPPDGIPTATAVVLMPKAGYVDDKDDGTTILYTGQGGRKKRNQQSPFVCDQELKKGNLALAKNYERKLPVRVIRGHMGIGSSGPGFLGYSYDGLYIIVSYEFSDGINGFKVFKYNMERLEDQPPIPPCIHGCTAHPWNTTRAAMAAKPLQVKDPTVDVKPICNQVEDPTVDVKPICMQVVNPPPVEMKQICT